MPELPEIEHLKRTLEPAIVGAMVVAVDLRRSDVVRNSRGKTKRRYSPNDLMCGNRIDRLDRRGKNLAIICETGRTLGVHLGMSGQVVVVKSIDDLPNSTHVHCVWTLQRERTTTLLVFRDPRRFGGLWLFSSFEAMQHERWAKLGADALTITADQLQHTLHGSKRCIKAALLDQQVIAGVGNIYADESLFMSHIHPRTIAGTLQREQIATLARAIKTVLRAAINAGGSSMRDYIDGDGCAGTYAFQHRVYGRAGETCLICGTELDGFQIAQRMTVACRTCQPLARRSHGQITRHPQRRNHSARGLTNRTRRRAITAIGRVGG